MSCVGVKPDKEMIPKSSKGKQSSSLRLGKKLNSRLVKISIGLLITALALWLSFRKLDWQVLKTTFLQANLFWVFLAAVNTIFTVYALGLRWQILLKTQDRISLSRLFRLNIISQYANIVMPARFGEVLRAYLISRQSRVSGAYAMGTVLIEKVLDFFIFVALWVIAPALFALNEAVRGYKIALVFCLLSLVLIIVMVLRPKILIKWARFFSVIIPKKFRERFINFLERGIEAFNLLKSVKTLLILFFLTIVFVVSQVLTNYFLFRAFDLPLSLWAALFLLLAVQVGNIPPSSPGKIGIFEFAVILALSVFAIPKSQALSYALMLHVVVYLPKILLGLIFITTMDVSLRKNYIVGGDEN